jgi:predicted RNase H-like HicB family nuclease
MAKYLVYLQPAEEGGYIVSCPALPGCVTQGETAQEALEMIRDAIEGYVESLRKHGEPVPPGLGEEIEKAEVIAVK